MGYLSSCAIHMRPIMMTDTDSQPGQSGGHRDSTGQSGYLLAITCGGVTTAAQVFCRLMNSAIPGTVYEICPCSGE